ncbi:MAG: hypothetical protein M1819_000876 [Sarea resinae]|nr:MAG: hypothetical protein M1819_000876 [Sarea resinae]
MSPRSHHSGRSTLPDSSDDARLRPDIHDTRNFRLSMGTSTLTGKQTLPVLEINGLLLIMRWIGGPEEQGILKREYANLGVQDTDQFFNEYHRKNATEVLKEMLLGDYQDHIEQRMRNFKTPTALPATSPKALIKECDWPRLAYTLSQDRGIAVRFALCSSWPIYIPAWLLVIAEIDTIKKKYFSKLTSSTDYVISPRAAKKTRQRARRQHLGTTPKRKTAFQRHHRSWLGDEGKEEEDGKEEQDDDRKGDGGVTVTVKEAEEVDDRRTSSHSDKW